jgi:molybdate transport system ATP-binding protein
LVTHDRDEAEKLGDVILMMDQGTIIGQQKSHTAKSLSL